MSTSFNLFATTTLTSFSSLAQKDEVLAVLTSKILSTKISYAAAVCGADQDLMWEYGDHAEYLGDLYAEALALPVAA